MTANSTQELDHPSPNQFPLLNPSLPASNTIANELDSPSFFPFATDPIPQLHRPVVPSVRTSTTSSTSRAFAACPHGWSRLGE
jgi:hypothetical protein